MEGGSNPGRRPVPPRNLDSHGSTVSYARQQFTSVDDVPAGLEGLRDLEELILDGNPIRRVEGRRLEEMKSLKTLSLVSTMVTNLFTTLHALKKLPSLERLLFLPPPVPADLPDLVPDLLSLNINAPRREVWGQVDDSEDGLVTPNYATDFRGMIVGEHGEELVYEFDIDDDDVSIEDVAFNQILEPFPALGARVALAGPLAAAVTMQVNRLARDEGRTPMTNTPYYREYFITNLPNLKSLDGVPITASERERAQEVVSAKFEPFAFGRQSKTNVQRMVMGREMGPGGMVRAVGTRAVERAYTNTAGMREITTALQGISPFPSCEVLCPARHRPRQFEYHPKVPHLMIIGTREGHTYIVNHETNRVLGSVGGAHLGRSVVLGLAWLHLDRSKFVSGSEGGSLHLYDIEHVLAKRPPLVQYSRPFPQLTSVSVSCDDNLVLASGHVSDVRLYDLRTGQEVVTLAGIHTEHINVSKFSNHSPHLFSTSSFDKTMKLWDIRSVKEPVFTVKSDNGLVMCIFSPDDTYLLSSAVDNEVKQFRTSDGVLVTDFDIPKRHSAQNYTRSYYCNTRDYIITGCCEENVVRIYSSSTGRQLCDVELSGEPNLYVQSLRGDPFRPFHMCVLVAYNHTQAPSELFKVNLLARNDKNRPGPAA